MSILVILDQIRGLFQEGISLEKQFQVSALLTLAVEEANNVVTQETAMVYRPGGTSTGLVFAKWSELVDFIGNAPFPVTIYIDDSIISPAVIPAGTWTFETDCVLSGIHAGQTAILHLADGCIFIGPGNNIGIQIITDSLEVHCLASSSGSNQIPLTLTANDELAVVRGASIQCDGDLPMIAIADNVLRLSLFEGGRVKTGSTEVISVETTGAMSVVGLSLGQLQSDTLSGMGTLQLLVGSTSANLSETQTNFTGTINTIHLDSGGFAVVTKAFIDSPYSVSVNDQVIRVDTSGGIVVLDLPAPSQTTKSYLVRKITTDTNKITLHPQGTHKLNGGTTGANLDLANSDVGGIIMQWTVDYVGGIDWDVVGP